MFATLRVDTAKSSLVKYVKKRIQTALLTFFFVVVVFFACPFIKDSVEPRFLHVRAFRSEYVRVALAVHVLGVALDAVAAMDFCERRRHVVRRTEELGVGKRAGRLHPQKIPLSPENSLDLEGGKERTPFTVSLV